MCPLTRFGHDTKPGSFSGLSELIRCHDSINYMVILLFRGMLTGLVGREESHEVQQREKQRLENSFVKKDLWVLADNKLNMRPRPMCPCGTEDQQPRGPY